MKRIPRAALLYLVIGAAVLFVGIRFSSRSPEREEIDFSEFRQAIDDGEVATAEIKDRDHEVVGKLADDTEYKVAYPAEYADNGPDTAGAHTHLPIAASCQIAKPQQEPRSAARKLSAVAHSARRRPCSGILIPRPVHCG